MQKNKNDMGGLYNDTPTKCARLGKIVQKVFALAHLYLQHVEQLLLPSRWWSLLLSVHSCSCNKGRSTMGLKDLHWLPPSLP